MLSTIVLLSTLHTRSDTRIFIKEAQTLASHFPPHKVLLMVADSMGGVDEKQGLVSIDDLGLLDGSRVCRMLRGPWRAFFAIHRIKPVIVHFHDPELMLLGIILKMLRYKVIYDVHEDAPRQTFGKDYIPKCIRYPVAMAIAALEWLFSRICDAVIPATPKIAERFPHDKTVTIQNFPLAAELLTPTAAPYAERPKSFAYVGGIDSIRGAVDMIRALELLNDTPEVRLELAGLFSSDGLEEALRVLPGWAAVNYHGQVSRKQVAKIMGSVKAGLVLFHPLPNHIDAKPNKMFEYMSSGLPIIASDFPLWRRIIDGAGCGMLVDPLDTKAISEAMRWLLDHPAEAEAMGQRGRKAVEKFYNWDVESVKLVNLYNTLLSQ